MTDKRLAHLDFDQRAGLIDFLNKLLLCLSKSGDLFNKVVTDTSCGNLSIYVELTRNPGTVHEYNHRLFVFGGKAPAEAYEWTASELSAKYRRTLMRSVK